MMRYFLLFLVCNMLPAHAMHHKRNKSKFLPDNNDGVMGTYQNRNGERFSAVDFEKIHKSKKINWTGKNVEVGIVESGLDNEHIKIKENLHPNLSKSMDLVKDSHGTGVADIVKSIAPRVLISLLNNKDGLEKALNEAGKQISIVNISRNIGQSCKCKGYDTFYHCPISKNIEKALENLTTQGIIVVKSAGNEDGKKLQSAPYYESMIKIANRLKLMIIVGNLEYDSNNNEYLSSSSVQAVDSEDPFICAAGSRLMTASENNGHRIASGTSFAAPMVSGALALLMEAYPNQEPQFYVNAVLDSARKTNLKGEKLGKAFGHGILDIPAALELAKTRFEKSYQDRLRNCLEDGYKSTLQNAYFCIQHEKDEKIFLMLADILIEKSSEEALSYVFTLPLMWGNPIVERNSYIFRNKLMQKRQK